MSNKIIYIIILILIILFLSYNINKPKSAIENYTISTDKYDLSSIPSNYNICIVANNNLNTYLVTNSSDWGRNTTLYPWGINGHYLTTVQLHNGDFLGCDTNGNLQYFGQNMAGLTTIATGYSSVAQLDDYRLILVTTSHQIVIMNSYRKPTNIITITCPAPPNYYWVQISHLFGSGNSILLIAENSNCSHCHSLCCIPYSYVTSNATTVVATQMVDP